MSECRDDDTCGLGIRVISEPTRAIFDIVFFNIYESPKSNVFRIAETNSPPAGLKSQLPRLFPRARVLLASRRFVTTSWLKVCEVWFSILSE